MSIKLDGGDRKICNVKSGVARQLCFDKGYLYYEGFTKNGMYPRPVCRMNTDFTEDIKMVDIDGGFITVYDGYVYYLNGSIYRVKLDWKSKPELYDKAAMGKNVVSVNRISSYEYQIVYDENEKPGIMRITNESRKAYNVIEKYFLAFEKEDYESMKALSTDKHNREVVHEGDVWGMKWAKAVKIQQLTNTRFLQLGDPESTMVFGVDVKMETAKTSSQYPATETFFFVILVKDSNGTWRVDGYTTG